MIRVVQASRRLTRQSILAMAALLFSSCTDPPYPDFRMTPYLQPPLFRVPPPAPVNPALHPAIFTPEYYGNWGLDAVHAGNAYVAGLNGAGVTVALVDSGVADIMKLQGQIAAHINVTAEPVSDDHGTSVAAVLAAKSDGSIMHGIAYGARLVDIKASAGGGFAQSDLATAIEVAAGRNQSFGAVQASIINLSLGGSAPIAASLRIGLDDAVAAGKVIVIAAGNGTGPVGASNPSTFALFATDADAKGQVIVAGALNEAGQLASYSDRAGTAKAFYLVAPGDRITTFDNRGTKISASGTSFAAPMISGAAAILEQEFPYLTAAKIVQILIRTADPLPIGTPDDYGAGLLNLAKAIQPFGALRFPIGRDPAAPGIALSRTRLSLGGVFGNAFPAALADAKVIALDSFDRGYLVSLAGGVAISRDGLDLVYDFMNPPSTTSVAARRLHGGLDGSGRSQPIGLAIVPGSGFKPPGADIALSLSDDTIAEFGVHIMPMNLATASLPDVAGADENGQPLFLRSELTALPQAGFIADGEGVSLSHRLAGAAMTIAALSGNNRADSYDRFGDRSDNRLVQMTAMTRVAGIDFGFGLGFLTENGRSLGSASNGALRLGHGADTSFLTGMAQLRVSDRLQISAAFTAGRSAVKDTGGFFDHVGPIDSNAFAVGAILQDGFAIGDKLGLQLAQPLRADTARAALILPTGIDATGALSRSIRSVDLAPRGREIDLQLAYRWSSRGEASNIHVQAFAMGRMEPGHDAKAPPDYVLGIRWSAAL